MAFDESLGSASSENRVLRGELDGLGVRDRATSSRRKKRMPRWVRERVQVGKRGAWRGSGNRRGESCEMRDASGDVWGVRKTDDAVFEIREGNSASRGHLQEDILRSVPQAPTAGRVRPRLSLACPYAAPARASSRYPTRVDSMDVDVDVVIPSSPGPLHITRKPSGVFKDFSSQVAG
ncbi:helicase c [Marssonina coronariae]|uniref:Helicase c n=1 Tax=Diplocarpon coronariae TaxID=2795749 RepID=A0A218Z7G1_9HELO|nr:helicase c [Marssonina coronariae]